MAALATRPDVEVDIGRALTAEESSRVERVLDRASAYVRAQTGRRYQAGATTVRRRVRDGRIVLDDPTSVQAVREVNTGVAATTLIGWILDGDAVLGLDGCWVEVDYTSAGDVPTEIRDVTAALAGRLLTAPALGLSARQAGPLLEQYRTVSDAATEADRAVLERHRLRLGPVVLS